MIPLFESQTGWVASGLPVPAVVKDHPSGFWVFAPGGKDRYSPEHFSTFLDLSPLQKFMGGGGPPRNGFGTVTRKTVGRLHVLRACRKIQYFHGGRSYKPAPFSRAAGIIPAGEYYVDVCDGEGTFFLRMYGMDYDFDWVPPAPSPEKSPQEKALDDFIERRKAKRAIPPPVDLVDHLREFDRLEKQSNDIDRAMRRLSFHEQDIHTRLMPYRREEK